MSIEKEIQQSAFRNDFQKAIVNIIFSASWLHERVKGFLAPEDITPQQYNILRILKGSKKPISTLEIRNRMLDKMSDTSRIVDRLVKKGLAEKKVSAADKRRVDVNISIKGISVLNRLDENNLQLDNILQSLTITEAASLNNLLDKMREPK